MRIFICTAFFFISVIVFPSIIMADCAVSIDPNESKINENSTQHLTVTNTGESTIIFVRIPTTLTGIFSPYSATSSNWDLMLEGGADVFINGSLAPGDSHTFDISGINGSEPGSYPWTLQTSAQADGTDALDCQTATLNLVSELAAIPTPAPTPTPIPAPNISSIGVAASATSAIITWRLDRSATGIVYYGKTTVYGNGETTILGESERVSLSGLEPSTTYHYQIQVTGEGGTTIVTDNTFTTGQAGVDTVITTTVTNVVSTTTTQTVTNSVTHAVEKKIEIRDQTPPKSTLTTDFTRPVDQTPKIVGTAQDDTGISLIEYSIDAGANWLPVDTIATKLAKKTQFSFQPDTLLDGNYSLKIRVTDLAGNVGFSATQTLVIDRLPPQIGPALWSVGPMSLDRFVLVGTSARLSVSAIGGPTTISVAGVSLIKNPDTGLWVGDIKFTTVGDTALEVNASDGADNVVTTHLTTITVLPAGSLGIPGTIRAYVLEPTTNTFVIWDAAPFGQTNPIKTNDTGEFQLTLPPGTYFLEADASGKMTTRTQIFTLEKTTAINPSLPMKPLNTWRPWHQVNEVKWTPSRLMQEHSDELGTNLPFFALRSTENEIVYSNSLRGMPTLLTILTTWAPTASEQIAALDEISTHSTLRTLAVFSQQPQSAVNIFKKRGAYHTLSLADPDGVITSSLQIFAIPTHIFLDRSGNVVKIVHGTLLASEILDIFNQY